MPLQDLRSWFAVGLAFLTPASLSAAPLPVIAERFEGEVMLDVGAAVQGLTPGQSFEPGTRIRTGADGRVEFSVQAVPTLKLGGRADLLLHSIDQNVLRAKLAGGALSVDTRARKGSKARDLRLNVGELRLRIQAAEAWVERSEQGSMVCLVSGSIDAQIADQPGRLDTPGQCLRHSGLTSMWSMVPQSVLTERLVLTQVRVREAIAVTPTPTPTPAPTPAPVVAVLPAPPPVVLTAPVAAPEPEPASERAPAATGLALRVPVAVQPPPIPPVPAPVVNPTMPTAGSAAIGSMAAVAVPEIPPEPVAVPNPRLPAATVLALDVASAESAPEVPPAPVASSPAKPEAVTAAPVPPVVAQTGAPSTPVTPTSSVPAAAVDSGADSVSAQAPKVEAEKVIPPALAPAPAPVAAAPAAQALAGVEVPSATEGATAAPAVAAAAAIEAPVAAPGPSAQAMAPGEAAAVVATENPASMPSHQPGAENGLDAEAAVALAMATAAAAEPIADDGRRWSVVLASFPLREPADKEVSRFKAMGLEAETREYRVGARHGFRVGVGRYTSRDEADVALAKMVGLNPEIVGWLAKY